MQWWHTEGEGGGGGSSMERGESGSQHPFLYYSHSLLTLAFYSLKGQSHSAGQRGSKCSNVCNVHSPWDALPKKRLFFIKFTNRRGTNQKNICKFDTVAQAFLQYKGSLQKSCPFQQSFDTKGGRGSAGIKLTLSFFMTYFFVGMFQKWSKMT